MQVFKKWVYGAQIAHTFTVACEQSSRDCKWQGKGSSDG